jgi:hypothetical protein
MIKARKQQLPGNIILLSGLAGEFQCELVICTSGIGLLN